MILGFREKPKTKGSILSVFVVIQILEYSLKFVNAFL